MLDGKFLNHLITILNYTRCCVYTKCIKTRYTEANEFEIRIINHVKGPSADGATPFVMTIGAALYIQD